MRESASLSKSLDQANLLCFSVLKDNEWAGSIAGYISGSSLVIDMLWLQKQYRRSGYGRTLVKNLEKWGRAQGATSSKLSTMEWWNAVPFYESMGYEVVFIDVGYETGAKQYSLKKTISSDKQDQSFGNSDQVTPVMIDDTQSQDAQVRLMKALSRESGELRGVKPVQEKKFFALNDGGAPVGNIEAYTLYGSVVIEKFWISEGYETACGVRLVQEVEKWGENQGATFAKLSTIKEKEAFSFYRSMGYKVIFTEDNEDGAKQYTLKKIFTGKSLGSY